MTGSFGVIPAQRTLGVVVLGKIPSVLREITNGLNGMCCNAVIILSSCAGRMSPRNFKVRCVSFVNV